jgi:putative ABC transport system permease protein
MDSLLQDIQFAFRQLRKTPGFAALAVITLAFGIGANTAMFTVVESVLVRPLPYRNADRLIYIGLAATEGFGNASYEDYRDIRDQAKNLQGVGVYSEDVGVLQTGDGSVSVATPRMSPSMFQMLGAQPLMGRTFSEEEGRRGGPLVIVLSEQLWRESFHSDPSILSRTVRVNNIPAAVVGVMPREFRFPDSIGSDVAKCVWLVMQPTEEMERARGYDLFTIIGALQPGVSLAAASSELQAISKHIRETDTHVGPNFGFRAASYQEMITGPIGPVLLALAIALGLVLLIACANVANLLIARCLVRQHEFAVRSALGASGLRLARQLIVEGGALSILGSALGFGLAWVAIRLVHMLPPDTIPRSTEIAVRWTVVLALAGIASVTTILSALIPSFLVARSDPQKALQASSRGVGARSVKGRLSGTVVAGQVALSALLLIATGLLFHTLWNLEHARLGFDVTRVTSFMAMPSDAAGFANLAVSQDVEHAPPSVATTVYAPALERMRALPGVQDAALITAPPLAGFDLGTSFDIVGQPHDRQHEKHARITAVSGDYARLMGTPVIRGRMITDEDTANLPLVIAINETLAKEYFGSDDPIGRQIDLNGPNKDSGMVKPYTIVGVLADQVDKSVSQPPQPLLMVPYEQIPTTSLFYQALIKTVVNFVVKTKTNIAVASAVRSVFKDVAPGYALDNFQTMQESVDKSNFSERLGLYLTGAFAGLAVLMVIAGLYGVLGQLVSYRRREFGIRMALGATQGGILRMVLRQGLFFVAAGLVVGILLALLGGNLVRSFLYGVTPADALTYAGVAIVLAFIGLLATLAPARRASSVEPMIALREE